MLIINLPKKNKWLNSYFNTEVAYSDITKLNTEFLEQILTASLGVIPEYTVQIHTEYKQDGTEVKTQTGQFIKIEADTFITWLCLSADFTVNKSDKDVGSNNSYFVQYMPLVLADCYLNDTQKEKRIELYLMGTTHNRATTEGQIDYYKLATTMGIRILNADNLSRPGINIIQKINHGFMDVVAWKKTRTLNQAKKKNNKSSYLIEEDDAYIFYGKTYGANGRETIFLLCALAKLANTEGKKIYLYEINDNRSSNLESTDKDDENTETKKFSRLLQGLGVIFYANSVDYIENAEVGKLLNDTDKDCRYQAEFKKNLLRKFNVLRDDNGMIFYDKNGEPIITDMKKCYLCDCSIQEAIIASHIQRVADINKLDIPFDEKRAKAVDAHNGLWLCANHDKFFEFGIIYFDTAGYLRLSEELSAEQRDYIDAITEIRKIDEKHLTDELKSYMQIHNDRLQNKKRSTH